MTLDAVRAAVLPTAVAAALGAVVWQLVVVLTGGWMPTIGEVADATAEALTEGAVWKNMLITAKRILIGFAGALLLGATIGIAMGMFPAVEAFMRPLMVIALAVPDPVYIILCALTIGLVESSAIVAMVAALTPFVAMILVGAVEGRDRRLDEMAALFGLSGWRYLRDVLGGQIAPALFAAGRVAFGFSWKLVVLVEALTQSDGIGSLIYGAYRLLRPAEMIALALIFLVVVGSFGQLAFRAAGRRMFAWK